MRAPVSFPSPASAFVAACLALAGLAGSGCSTRTPSNPASGPSVPWKNPTSMALVLENVRVTFDSTSVDNYARSLADSFSFIPDPADLSEIGDPNFFTGWGKTREVETFTNILRLPARASLEFDWPNAAQLTPHGTQDPDTWYYQDLQYQMTVRAAGRDTVFSGKADLYMKETNGLYAITAWQDKQDGSAHLTLGLVRWRGTITF